MSWRAGIYGLILAGMLAGCASRGDEPAAEPEKTPVSPSWTGSEACAECHSDLYDKWKGSPHAISMRRFSPEVLAKPFDGEVFSARNVDHRLGPGGEMTCEGPGGKQATYPVEWVMGARRLQMFLTTLDRGRIQVLPVYNEVPKKKWFHYTDMIFLGPRDFEVPPDSPNSWYMPARNFNSKCGFCHVINYDMGYDPDTGVYNTTWGEDVVGCEACHGPGRAHIEKWRKEDDKAPDPIRNQARMTVERSNQVCGSCHAEAERVVVKGYLPGDDLYDFLDIHGLEDSKQLLPDGRARELLHNFAMVMQSRCYPVKCSQCHDPHGSGLPGDLHKPLGDWACASCHGEIVKNVADHSHHPAENAGSRCIACHMPRLVIEGGHGWTHDHTISTPSAVNTIKYGLPNACRTCHVLKDTGWEYSWIEEWWPGADQRNHRVKLAEALYGGRRKAPEAKPALVELLKDENPLYRAAAAWSLGDYPVDLRPQLKDKHVLVRRGAVRGVAARQPEALIPLLDDPNRVLKRAAALALAEKKVKQPFDFIRQRPKLRKRVLRTLNVFVGHRPDDARLHFAIGALHEIDGRTGEAILSYERYLRINPHNATIRKHLEKLKGR